jgi:hypothetical protein
MIKQVSFLTFFGLILYSGTARCYDFSVDAAGSEDLIVRDLQKNQLDMSNFAPEARDGIIASMESPIAVAVVGSPLYKVCSTVSVQNDYGRQHQFRSIHAAGEVDWVVTTSNADATRVESLIFFVLPSGATGAPAILPMMPDPNRMKPATQIGCMTVDDRKRADQQIQAACKQFPEFCPRIRGRHDTH